MTPRREWLKPPRTLLLLLYLLSLVSVSALCWFGGRLLRQERDVEAQRSQERLEQAADRIAATVRGTLAETGERLGAWESGGVSNGGPSTGLLLLLKNDNLTASPPDRMLYYPSVSSQPEADASVFGEAEFLEFTQAQPAQALAAYERLASSANPAIRAGALLRMARVLRNTGKMNESRAAYSRLASSTGVRVAGAPAALVASYALCELSDPCSQAPALRSELLNGRWHLTRGQFQFYWSELSRLANVHDSPPPEAVAFSEAAARAWEERQSNQVARGQETIWIGDQPFLLMWRGTPEHRAVFVAKPGSIMGESPGIAGGVRLAMVDSEGRIVAGQRDAGSKSRAVIRTSAETQLPWTLYVKAIPPFSDALITPRNFLVMGIIVMVIFLVLGTYFIARAIRREAETLRMQSAFVSAVSHEFRSPLTSLRQLSEILALGRVASEERRQLYYETLVQETTRLQRLIESLLNFGRMEAGARRYRFEELDASLLVRRVVSEFEPQIASSGRRIELEGTESRCMIEADPDAISVALRNLLDNALKYSPGRPVVWVEWGVRDERVAITVRDQGPGIADSEKKAIFRKFVRGSAADATNAKGSGVGLAMVRYIVEAHGGDITVASEQGQGSTFTMLLPVVEGA